MPASLLPGLKSELNQSGECIPSQEELAVLEWETGTSFISYGIHIGIRTNDPTVLERLPAYLPPGWKPSPSNVLDKLYLLFVSQIARDSSSDRYYLLCDEQGKLAHTTELEEALDTLDSNLRLWIGTSVQHRLFVHAGVVGWRGKAIVIPGRSFSGKTTLVAALVEAGATYYSDEYAVFDVSGLVHPYPRPLSLRQATGERVKRCPVQELGGKSGTEPLPVGLVVHTQYQSGAQWCPSTISPGQAVLTLLDNTLVARLRPEFALPILFHAVCSALKLKGKRGEAQDVAVALLKQLED